MTKQETKPASRKMDTVTKIETFRDGDFKGIEGDSYAVFSRSRAVFPGTKGHSDRQRGERIAAIITQVPGGSPGFSDWRVGFHVCHWNHQWAPTCGIDGWSELSGRLDGRTGGLAGIMRYAIVQIESFDSDEIDIEQVSTKLVS